MGHSQEVSRQDTSTLWGGDWWHVPGDGPGAGLLVGLLIVVCPIVMVHKHDAHRGHRRGVHKHANRQVSWCWFQSQFGSFLYDHAPGRAHGHGPVAADDIS